MLSSEDKSKIQELIKNNSDFNYLIKQISDEHTYTMTKIFHEIRNPLALINSSLQIIEAQHPEVKQFKYWKETLADIDFLKLLLSNLSSYSSAAKLAVKDIDLVELLKTLCSFSGMEANLVSHNLDLHADSNIPIIQGDPLKLKEAFTNILRNALEAIDESGNICIHVSASEYYIQVDITDNGCGIAKEYHENIFEPFVTTKYNGMGLGLPICQRIIKAHNGSIIFNTNFSCKTTFTIRLPIKQA